LSACFQKNTHISRGQGCPRPWVKTLTERRKAGLSQFTKGTIMKSYRPFSSGAVLLAIIVAALAAVPVHGQNYPDGSLDAARSWMLSCLKPMERFSSAVI